MLKEVIAFTLFLTVTWAVMDPISWITSQLVNWEKNITDTAVITLTEDSFYEYVNNNTAMFVFLYVTY